MTIEEIIKELDALKDFTNDHGRGVIEGLKREIAGFAVPPNSEPLVPQTKASEPTPEPVKAKTKEKWSFKKKQH